jgi:flagellar biosynthesis GTPase FlhF
VTNALGLTEKEGKGKTEFQKAIEKGNISGAVTQIKAPLTLNQLKGDGKQQIQDLANQTLNMPTDVPLDTYLSGIPAPTGMSPGAMGGRIKPVDLAVDEARRDRERLEKEIYQQTSGGETVGKRADRLEQERLEREKFEREQERLERERKRKEEQAAQQAAAEKARIEREKQEKQIYQSGPTTGSDDDGGDDSDTSSSIDDFFGSQPSQPNYGYTPSPVYTSQTAGGQQRPQSLGVPAPASSYGTDSGFGYGGSDVVTPFYVGGVPTKPMKPQRLKKGGLAKMKVKPKRMKKGGLASRKK